MNGESFEGELASIDANGIATFRPLDSQTPNQTRELKLDELIRWGHPTLPQAHAWVLLTDGSLLVATADWSGGAAVRTDGDNIVVLTQAFGELTLPRAVVRGVVFDQRRHPHDRRELENLVREADGKRDQVLLTNEDQLSGEVVELTKGSLTFATNGAETKLPLSRVRAVAFGYRGTTDNRREPSPSLSLQGTRLLIGLRDGSMLTASAIEESNDGFILSLTDGPKLAGHDIHDVVFLQSLGSEKFVYLSDLEPVDYRHVPYLSIELPWERDRNSARAPLKVGDQQYLKGIGMHSAARLTYRLDGNFKRFDAAVAIDDSAGKRGSVTFGVYLLRDGQLHEAYKSEIVRGGETPHPISIDVSGAQGMTLIVDYADRGDELDRADWLDARLIKN